MGIRGLTTFIQSRSHLYLEKYELHDTYIVIDGNAIACHLYKWHCKANDCFGGDYDKFANVIVNFFQILSQCNITPYVIFDGGYESRKIATVISRMKHKIRSADELDTVTEGSVSVFPLFLRETFQDIVMKLNIKCVRCDFESDTDIASIAKLLNCPVMSNDSDFFIFDVLYIPFSTVEICVRKKRKPHSKDTYNYVCCEIYRVEKFLNSFGGMDKNNLPILAVLLGNDYVKRSVFSSFYQNLKMQKGHGQSEQQKRIKSIIIWLQNETVESAVRKVLSRYKCKRRKLISEKIQNAIKGYNCLDSDYLKYLEITSVNPRTSQAIDLNNIDINDIDEEDVEEDDVDLDQNIVNSDEENSSSEDTELDCYNVVNPNVPTIFFENYRKCLYPPSFMDILTQNKYYCIPQVENSTLKHSHTISSDILSAIHKMLTDSNDNLICIARNESRQVKKQTIPCCEIDVPSFMEIQSMSLESRKSVLLKVLGIDENFVENCLCLFPESWHLFIISLKYLIDKVGASWPLLYSVLLCKIFLNYVDELVGVCRSTKLFKSKFEAAMQNVLNNDKKVCDRKNTVIESLQDISYNDSLQCLQNFISCFQIDIKLKVRRQLFDRNLVHSMAQFQSCLLHVKYLNNLLNLPYPNFVVSDFYNGTFIYNLTSNFMQRANLDNYIKIKLQNSPTILNALLLIVEKIKEHSGESIKSNAPPKRRKKKKTRKEIYVKENEENLSEEEFVVDPNNKFSLLCTLNKSM